jgi:hypothetical protein
VTTPIQVRFRNSEATDLDEEIREIDSPSVMGRGRDTDIMLPDPGVSRRHAALKPGRSGTWFIEDLHSTRGTWLNGRRLDAGESAEIVPGDLVEIRPWSLLIGGSAQSRGQLLSASMTVGMIEEAVAAPFLRERFEAIVAAVQRAIARGGPEEVFGAMLDSLLAASELDRAMILCRLEDDEAQVVAIRARSRMEEQHPRPFSGTLVNEAIGREATVRMEESPEFSGTESIIASGAEEALARVIPDGENRPYILYADRRAMHGEDHELVAWFDAVASLCEVALRMQRGRRAEAERARLLAEMESARAVQELLLPETTGRLGALSWRSLAIPGVEIAGDLLEVRTLGDSLHVMLGDVSGKGARAGLIMAGAQACAETLVDMGMGPGELVPRLDEWAIRNTPDGAFITLWCGRIGAEGSLRFVDAGHGHILVHRADGRLESVPSQERWPLGIVQTETEEAELQLEPGDALIVFSDGLVEEPGREPSDGRYDIDRLKASITRHGPDPQLIHADLVEWCGRTQLGDDLTILVVYRDA